jgi:hypothetical protein
MAPSFGRTSQDGARKGEGQVEVAMNAMDRVLNDDLNRLLDRLAGSVPGRCLETAAAHHPVLRVRLDEAEAELAAIRADLIEGYGRWLRALEDVENLWALAAWRSTAEEAPQQAATLAA